MLERNALEVVRQTERGERPGSRETRRAEPAPRYEEVNGSIFPEAEDVALRIADPQQLRPRHRRVSRRTGQLDQLRRSLAHEHHRNGCRRLLAAEGRLDVLPVVIVGQLEEVVRQFGGRRPRSVHIYGSHPGVVVAKVVRGVRSEREQIPVRVDGEAQVVVLDRAPGWLSVDVHQHGGPLAEEDHGRIRLYAVYVLWRDVTRIHGGK